MKKKEMKKIAAKISAEWVTLSGMAEVIDDGMNENTFRSDMVIELLQRGIKLVKKCRKLGLSDKDMYELGNYMEDVWMTTETETGVKKMVKKTVK